MSIIEQVPLTNRYILEKMSCEEHLMFISKNIKNRVTEKNVMTLKLTYYISMKCR